MHHKKINFHFYNTLCSKSTHSMLFKHHGVTSGNAAQTFFGLIADGLNQNPLSKVYVNSILPVNYAEQKKRFWNLKSEEENSISYNYVPIFNLPIFKNLLSSFYIFFQILFKKVLPNEKNVVILDFLRFSINFPAFLACKLRGIKTVVIVTDLPGEDVLKKTLKVKLRNLIIFSLSFDFYICVTKELNLVVNKKNRPFLIIESFANIKFETLDNFLENKFQEKILIYAGSLYEQYGLKHLIEGFKMIKDQDIRLWFFGVGPFSLEIKKYAENDSRIQYKGVIPNNELIEILTKATLLINPRPSHESYTKYSFPSKNMEYMSVGTPLLTTKLPGIPKDHFPFIFLIKEESSLGIYNAICSVLQKSKKELHEFGLHSKRFTLKEKNNIYQSTKIINLIKNI